MLKSTLLLSLLTPALDGLLSTPLLPSRLYGTELGDTSEPGRIKVWNGERDKSVIDIMEACEKITVFSDSYVFCNLMINQYHSFLFVILKTEEVNNSGTFYDRVRVSP